jgi:SET domain-containing protein
MPDDRHSRQCLTIDAMHEGNVARFLNHSCAPNLEKQTMLTARAGCSLLFYVGFIAAQDGGIKAGTELTYDYKWDLGAAGAIECMCGAAECRGRIGQFDMDAA